MQRSRRIRTIAHIGLTAALASVYAMSASAADGTVSVAVPIHVSAPERGAGLLELPDFGRIGTSGWPALPTRILPIAIPPGAVATDVTWTTGPAVDLGTVVVPPAPLKRVVGAVDPDVQAAREAEFAARVQSIYGGDEPFPLEMVSIEQTGGFRKYNLVDVRVTPFEYTPSTHQLRFYPDITVQVHYEVPATPTPAIADHVAALESQAQDLIVNYAAAQSWYPVDVATSGESYDTVVITLDSLTPVISELLAWEVTKGHRVRVVTTSWIEGTYDGYDLAEKIRNFLREKYPSSEWGIESVLLVGHYDDVPVRRVSQNIGYGSPETDFYYAELSLPDGQSWDADGDRRWGENGDAYDFYNEVIVGRIPWSDPSTVASICAKSVAYEQNDDPSYKQNMLLLGAFFWNDDPNPRTDNAILMETKIDQPWMSNWTFTRLYEKNGSCWSDYDADLPLTRQNAIATWAAGTYGIVNWAGHGSPTSTHVYGLNGAAFIRSDDCALLNDDYPAIVFADSCSNQDTDHVNLGQSLLRQGAVGFVGSTKVALGCPGWSGPLDGSTQSLDYYFTKRVTIGDYTLGQAHQHALRQMHLYDLWDSPRYEVAEWGVLLGNPNLRMVPPPAFDIVFPDGRPTHLAPGESTELVVQLEERMESAADASVALCYRVDDGPFVTLPLLPRGANQYGGVFPAIGCGKTVEYYIQATGAEGGVARAPVRGAGYPWTAEAGVALTPIQDDFEADLGWTSESNGATAGFWQRGVPVDDPGWSYDPANDGDGSGQCYLTQNELGNTDVDNGSVYLISPLLDTSQMSEIEIAYDYYLYLSRQGLEDALTLEVSTNGVDGPWIMVARYDARTDPYWEHVVHTPGELDSLGVMSADTMQFRFVANDTGISGIVEAGVDGFSVSGSWCETPAGMCPGDFDCDGDRDYFDIEYFIAALEGEMAWHAHIISKQGVAPTCPYAQNCDVDGLGDGATDHDVTAFLAVLGQPCPQ